MKVIRAVNYRHIAGYLMVVSKTKEGALQAAKKIGTHLLSQVAENLVCPPRYKGTNGSEHVFELPVILGTNPSEVRGVLAELVLAGTV